MKFSWLKAILYGIVLWAVMFAFVSAFVAFDLQVAWWVNVLTMILGVALAYWFAHRLDIRNTSFAFAYGASWVAIGLLLDGLIGYQFNPNIFSSWELWTGYTLILLTPWVRTMNYAETHGMHQRHA